MCRVPVSEIRVPYRGRFTAAAVLLFSGLLFALPLFSAFHIPSTAGAAVLVVLLVSAHKPEDGLLLVAGLLPLATPLGLLMTPAMSGRQAGELLLLAFLTAASVRYALCRSAAPSPFGLAATACVAVIVAATFTGLARQLHWGASLDLRPWRDFWKQLTATYLTDAGAYPALSHGMIWLEGVVLARVAEIAIRRTPATSGRVCGMLIIGGTAASAFTLTRVAEVYLRHAGSLRDTTDALATVRIGIHAADINAVGSLYALFVVPAFWSAFTDRWRVWWWAAFSSLVFALWWTGSRAAVAAGCCGVLIVLVRTRTIRRRTVMVAVSLAAIVVALSVLTARRPLSSADALRIRLEMTGIGVRIVAAHPAFGVGPGQFVAASRRFVEADLAFLFPRAAGGENAHNNFVQVLAEFGLIGGSAFAAMIGLTVLMAWRAIGQAGPPPELVGLVGGLAAFLITCLFGHPLLTPQCLWLFFLVLGVVAGRSWPAAASDGSLPTKATWLFVLLVACSIPFRLGFLA
jgi:O-Antigen ligase